MKNFIILVCVAVLMNEGRGEDFAEECAYSCKNVTCNNYPDAVPRGVVLSYKGHSACECAFTLGDKPVMRQLCEIPHLCTKDNPIKLCDPLPCDHGASCMKYPMAECRNQLCGKCKAEYFLRKNGVSESVWPEVTNECADCEEKDFCPDDLCKNKVCSNFKDAECRF